MEINNNHIIEAFKDIYFKKETGILRAQNDHIKKHFYFIEGNLVFAHSNILSEKIGQIMIALGYISSEDLNELLAEKPKDTRFGTYLQNLGYINPIELMTALTQQIKKITFGTFKWNAFILDFEKNDNPVFKDLIIEIATPDLIIEGLFQINNAEMLFFNIPNHMNNTINKNEDESLHLPRGTLGAEETLLLSLIEEGTTLREVLSKSGLSYNNGLLSVYALYISGLISFAGKQWIESPAQEALTELPDLNNEDKVIEYVDQIYPKLYKINYYDLLCIEPDASFSKIQEHYDYLMDHLQPIYYYSEKYKTEKPNLKYIIDYYNEAFDVLSHPSARDEYNEKMKEGKIEERPHPDTQHHQEPVTQPVTKYSFEIHPVEAPSDSPHAIPSLEKMETTEMIPAPTEELKYAEYLYKLKKYNETLKALKNIDVSYKKESLYHFLMGATLSNYPDKSKESEEYLLRAFTMEPKNPDYLLQLGLFYKNIGLGIKAFKYFNEVLKIDPNNIVAKEALGLKHPLLDE
ncbi:MAG: hypothetical protein A2Y62_17250 [Candidatus Fischerbacteria bacterium RBG_13_37_8]|uniref:J domain-containing protein n=1 Tax=Candidatus Fischerbacteria bacterium RBG_13_37_8 TaxID=1817863 RepID=A0A1F5VG47_9BACT|nr:MAG: hypothetical protein A2Y62_17250 [Candidatus Fischerbacteria bacterium RBG_13_37_8]